MVSQGSTCTAAREASSAAASYSRGQRAAACGVRHSFQTDTQWSGNKITILYQSEHQKIPPHPKHPRLKNHFFSSRNAMYLLAATINTKGDTSGMPRCNPQSTHAPPRRDQWGQNTSLCIPHAHVCRSPLFREQTRLALLKLEQNLLRLPSWGRRSDWAVSYCTDQLLTPNFSGERTKRYTWWG